VAIFAQRDRWVVVEGGDQDEDLPEKETELPHHLAWVEGQCHAIKDKIDAWVGRTTLLRGVEQHFVSQVFSSLPAVAEAGQSSDGVREFTILTGSHPHFLRLEPTVLDCPYHDFGACAQANAASRDRAVVRSSVNPRSLYASGMVHHCAHRDVLDVKRQAVEGLLLGKCGPRSNNHDDRFGGSFCEIFKFEEHLCCRTCAFEEVCGAAELFRLPCNQDV
jgi:hypothetical protein